MLTNRNAVLACLMLASISACGGRSSLNDFTDGADNLLPGSGGGAKIKPDAGATGDKDGDAESKDAAGPVVIGPAERGNIGAQCKGDKACNGETTICLEEIRGSMSLTTRFPNGYCAIEECATDDDCPAATGCLDAYGVLNCTQRCNKESDCRTDEGYECGTPEGSSDPDTYCIPTPIDPSCLLCPDTNSMVQCTQEKNPRVCFGGAGGQGNNAGGN